MNYLFYLEAEKAVQHYFDVYPELGSRFREEVRKAIQRILNAPEAWHPKKKSIVGVA